MFQENKRLLFLIRALDTFTFNDNALSLVEANSVSVLDTRLLTYCSSSFIIKIQANQPFSLYASIHPYVETQIIHHGKAIPPQLPKIPLGELPADSSCMICLNAYGAQSAENGVIESPVRLPCTHHVGLECITLWLSAKTSCPYCRKDFFFPPQPRSYMFLEGFREVEAEVAERAALLGIETRRARIGGPALRNYEGNDNVDPSLAELALVINVFALFSFGIVLIIIFKCLL